MLEKLSKNKKVLILFVLVMLFAAGAIVGITLKNDSKESAESNVNIETEQNKDTVKENDEDEGGLEDMKEVDEKTENKTDASGSWETTEDSKLNGGNINGDNQNNSNQNDSQQDDNNQDKDNENDNNEDGESDESGEDIIEDEQTWGEVF